MCYFCDGTHKIAHNYHKILGILCEISNRFKGKKLCDLKKKKKKTLREKRTKKIEKE
jgi:hypothetical protein